MIASATHRFARRAVKKEKLVERIIGVYTLVYEADEWEKKNGRVPNTTLIESLVRGDFDVFFRKINTHRADEITASDKARAAKKAGL